MSTTTQMEKPATEKPTSIRFDEHDHAVVDEMAKDLVCESRSDAVRSLVRAWEKNQQIRELVQEAAFVRLPELPRARRYRVVAPFNKMVGIAQVNLKRGQVLSTRSFQGPRQRCRGLSAQGFLYSRTYSPPAAPI